MVWYTSGLYLEGRIEQPFLLHFSLCQKVSVVCATDILWNNQPWRFLFICYYLLVIGNMEWEKKSNKYLFLNEAVDGKIYKASNICNIRRNWVHAISQNSFMGLIVLNIQMGIMKKRKSSWSLWAYYSGMFCGGRPISMNGRPTMASINKPCQEEFPNASGPISSKYSMPYISFIFCKQRRKIRNWKCVIIRHPGIFWYILLCTVWHKSWIRV